MIKEFLKRKHEYSNLSMILQNILWALYGVIIWNLLK